VTQLAQLDALDHLLVEAGFPAMTSWWRETLGAFYASGRRQLVLRVGRRGGKSSTLCRVAVASALFGEHEIPPGDIGVVAFVSVRREEATERLRTIRAILDALGVTHRPIEGGVELVDRPIAFRVYTASVAGVSGFTCVAAFCDEVSKWKDADSGVNPAREVLAGLRPTLAGQAHARLFLSSSPMGRQDAHAVAFDAGDTDFQLTASAQTWIARPSLTEAECRALEPDEDVFRREYGIQPFDGSASGIFGEAALLACTRKGGPLMLPREHGIVYFAAEDPAARANGWTCVVGYARQVSDDMVAVIVAGAREWRAPRGGALDTDQVYRELSEWVGEWGVRDVHTDQWSFDSRRALAARHGLTLHLETSTQATKVASAESFRRRVQDRLCELPDLPALRADLCGVSKWISKNGSFSIQLEKVGSRHCDYAPALFLLADKAFSEEDGMPDWAKPGAARAMAEAFGGQFDPGALGPRATRQYPDDAPRGARGLKHRVAFDGSHELTGSARDGEWPARFSCVFIAGQPARHSRECQQWGSDTFVRWQRAVEQRRHELGK
jgi:hypothetical protein